MIHVEAEHRCRVGAPAHSPWPARLAEIGEAARDRALNQPAPAGDLTDVACANLRRPTPTQSIEGERLAADRRALEFMAGEGVGPARNSLIGAL